MSNTPPTSPPLHPDTRIGHIHLKVTNLERSLHFYRDILGFTETRRPRTPTGQLNMTTLPLDLTALFNENP